MLARVFSLITASSVLLAVSAMPTPGGSEVSQCNGGEVYCCNSYHEVEKEDESWKAIYALLNLDIEGLTGGIAANCSPLGVAAIGSGASCSSQTVCCQGNQYNGLINVGCSPINVAL
ncbi:hypothetical protein EST38_g6511 [Candolleomyces aberdarensis]|uniref:Hydrophobin n=1 Tax=Candolleomyces aberdarensis TaxID=2316362 RepID=A0A4Q2DHI4_9AGAR|nr:hypothetical protein EST38_g6511 [Candolleomyces aberdarensis]